MEATGDAPNDENFDPQPLVCRMYVKHNGNRDSNVGGLNAQRWYHVNYAQMIYIYTYIYINIVFNIFLDIYIYTVVTYAYIFIYV